MSSANEPGVAGGRRDSLENRREYRQADVAQALPPAAPALLPALVRRAARAVGFHPLLCAAQRRIVTHADACQRDDDASAARQLGTNPFSSLWMCRNGVREFSSSTVPRPADHDYSSPAMAPAFVPVPAIPAPCSAPSAPHQALVHSLARLTAKLRFWRVLPIVFALAILPACRQDMHNQPRYRPLGDSNFFPDMRASRPLVPGTIARGHLRADTRYFAGRQGAEFVTELPVKLTRDLLLRGQQRFDIFCSPCHGRAGDGEGMVVQRGFRHPPSFHQERLYNQPVGHYYDVISNGFGAMASYASRVPVADRWAIVAYIRALQLSRNATIDDVPPAERPALQAPGGPQQ